MTNRIDETFARLRASRQGAFMPFVAAGDPDMATSEKVIRECCRRGADLIELGIPFSDPVADGPAIQAAFTRALDKGATVEAALAMMRRLRKDVQTPIVAMLSYSIVYRIGSERFMRRAAEAGLDGVIIPDLPVEESEVARAAAEAHGLRMIHLVAPTTTEARLAQIVERAAGFIYCVSVSGVTGERARLPADLLDRVRRLKERTPVPIAVGFGISEPEHARMVTRVADGAIVGSGLVNAVHAAVEQGRDPAEAAGRFVEAMAAAAHG